MTGEGSFWHSVPTGPNPPEELYVVIETPKGSKNKYEISKDFPGMMLDRVLHSSVMYPIDYGLIPRTYYLDGDPLDAMVLVSQKTYPGIVIEARPIAMMEMIDQGDLDNKILTVAKGDPMFRDIESMDQLPKHLLNEISNFFETYKILEKKKTEVNGWKGKNEAVDEIKKSIGLYNDKFKK
ncbi:inorganic pyrophosphatase [uncultured archaeon]|nr:inorganic pyrophosphatase [uncultured archaeon]HKJ96394.1 inorganic diphosphatase [Thermoplasmataceae archaeon]